MNKFVELNFYDNTLYLYSRGPGRGHRCQITTLHQLEDFYEAMDKNFYVCALTVILIASTDISIPIHNETLLDKLYVLSVFCLILLELLRTSLRVKATTAYRCNISLNFSL